MSTSIYIGGIAVLCVALLFWWRPHQDGMMVSPKAQQMAEQSNKLFSQSRHEVGTREFVRTVSGGDPALFEDFRTLYNRGQLTAEEVQKTLNRG